MKLSAKTAIGLSAAALVALSPACTSTKEAPVFDDSRVEGHAVGESVDVETIDSIATYVLWYPHVKDGAYTVKLAINCIACTKWMPGHLVLVMNDGSLVKADHSSIDLVDYLAPFEVRRGDVSFQVKDPKAIDRIVLMRGKPIAPAAKWNLEDNAPIPTLKPEPPVKVVALGDECVQSGPSTAKTEDGQKAYCSRLDYTDTYLWAARAGVIPNEPVAPEPPPVLAAVPKPKPSPRPAPPPPPPIFVLPPLPPWLR